MSSGPHPYIAREGWLLIAAIAASGLIAKLNFGLLAAIPLWLLCGVMAYLFRDPERAVPAVPLGVVSPVDGEVLAIEAARDLYLERDVIRVAIRMNRLGSYVTRAPIEGKLVKHWYTQAEDVSGSGSDRLDRYAMWLQTDENDDVVLVMGVGSKALKPVCYYHSGERIGQGDRCGLVRFGGHIEVLLPASSRVEAAVGDKITAGSDILAMLIHQSVPAGEAQETAVVLKT